MLLPDLLIAHHVTGKQHYLDFYHRVVARYKDNPVPELLRKFLERGHPATKDHSPEGQRYEALYNLIRYERDPELRAIYCGWVSELWEKNWMEGNSLFAYMTLALLPDYTPPSSPGAPRSAPAGVPHAEEGLRLANDTLRLFPVDRVLRPVMNSLRPDIELLPKNLSRGRVLSAKPLPINLRPHDNEYEWKGNPYQPDGWLKPAVTAMQFACDDPQVAWFCDSSGRVFMTLDGGGRWQDMTQGLMGANVRNIVASDKRTFVVWAHTDQGVRITRDGGMSWRTATEEDAPAFKTPDFSQWHDLSAMTKFRIDDKGRLVRSDDGGATSQPAMDGWRIPLATSVFSTPWGIIAGGPGGCYRTTDGQSWEEMKLWEERETGAADFLHAYWMGRYYGFLPPPSSTR
jgi:hypothetical protein